MKRIEGESGFTLTELLISVVIIAIGVVGFASAVGLAATELWMGRRDTEVSMLLTDQAEQLKAMPYDSVKAGSRQVDNYQLNWSVQAGSPKRVVLEATYDRHGGGRMADTVVVYIPR
ncbi:MAG: prepilin-type N-terminal cleavage/methylation domain-containing protein [Gemmatimonadota bacterium]|nr:MAG: prepilin-type N-terminal cleavage/methylation domain-containing protein [Gemmatimonadota bacterium]